MGLVKVFGMYLFELRGETLVLLRERRDQQALLLLRLPLLVPVLVEVCLQHLQVLLQLSHLQVVLLLDGVEPPPQVVLLLLQFLKGICNIWSVCQSDSSLLGLANWITARARARRLGYSSPYFASSYKGFSELLHSSTQKS